MPQFSKKTATAVWTLTVSVCVTGLLSLGPLSATAGSSGSSKQLGDQTVRVALIQFDAAAEKVDANLAHAELLVRKAAGQGAKWIMFHEGTLCDYTDRLAELAEQVPDGPSTQRLQKLSGETDTLISFGLSEKDQGHYYISQVFVQSGIYLHRYRKTWLHLAKEDEGFRNEWARYDPGTGPESFLIDGIRACCFICADGNSVRCRERIRDLHPQIVFYPNNRRKLPDFPIFGDYARQIGAPMLVTNRIGRSWHIDTFGGCAIYDAEGNLSASANRDGREEILIHDLHIPAP